MEVPTVCFAISSSTVCLTALLSVLLLPRRNCSFRPRFLTPLLHSDCARRLFPNIHPFRGSSCNNVPGPIFLSSLFDRRSLWPRPLRRAIPAWRVIPLQAMANFFRDPPSPSVLYFSCRRRPMATCRTTHRFFSALTFFTAASSLRTYGYSATDISSGIASRFSR
jgi:hypothetical protein